jgi:hypothetical protein
MLHVSDLFVHSGDVAMHLRLEIAKVCVEFTFQCVKFVVKPRFNFVEFLFKSFTNCSCNVNRIETWDIRCCYCRWCEIIRLWGVRGSVTWCTVLGSPVDCD